MQTFQKQNYRSRAVHKSQLKMEDISNGWGILGEWTKIKREKKFKIQIIFAEKQKMAELVKSNPASITIFLMCFAPIFDCHTY